MAKGSLAPRFGKWWNKSGSQNSSSKLPVATLGHDFLHIASFPESASHHFSKIQHSFQNRSDWNSEEIIEDSDFRKLMNLERWTNYQFCKKLDFTCNPKLSKKWSSLKIFKSFLNVSQRKSEKKSRNLIMGGSGNEGFQKSDNSWKIGFRMQPEIVKKSMFAENFLFDLACVSVEMWKKKIKGFYCRKLRNVRILKFWKFQENWISHAAVNSANVSL